MVAILNLHKLIPSKRESKRVSTCDNPFTVYAVLFPGTATNAKIVKRASLWWVNCDEVGTHACEKLCSRHFSLILKVHRGEARTHDALIGHRQHTELGHAQSHGVLSFLVELSGRTSLPCAMQSHLKSYTTNNVCSCVNRTALIIPPDHAAN